MKHRILARPGLLLGLAALSTTALAGMVSAQGGDPFSPGQRWTCAPAAGEAWIPSRAAFAASGNLAWAAAPGGQGRLMVLDISQEGDVTPHFLDTSVALSSGTVEAVAGNGAHALDARTNALTDALDRELGFPDRGPST